MAAKNGLRKRFFVDYRVQGALIVRVVLYWLMCLLTMMLLLLGWDMITGPEPAAERPSDRALGTLSDRRRWRRCCCCRR